MPGGGAPGPPFDAAVASVAAAVTPGEHESRPGFDTDGVPPTGAIASRGGVRRGGAGSSRRRAARGG